MTRKTPPWSRTASSSGARLELVAEVTTTFKAVIQKIDYKKLHEAVKKRGKDECYDKGHTASAMKFMLAEGEDGAKGWAKCFLFSPLWIPFLPFAVMYIMVIVPALKRVASALAENSSGEIELKLNRPGASSNDDWGGGRAGHRPAD